jgi:membrane protein
MLTIFFAIARGFGVQEVLRETLLEKFQDQKIAILEIIAFAEKLLDQTRGGLIAGIGAVLLFWTAIQLLSSIEEALNHIWDIHKIRSFRHMFSEYFSWLFIAPLLFVLSNSAAVLILKYAEQWIGHMKPLFFIVRLTPYALFWLLFSCLYFFLPNTKVRYSSAFIGGVVAGTLYFIAQWGYIYFQIGVSRYGAIYGSFAALPLFLIWVQVSWFLLLFGAEMSYAHQTLDTHEFESTAKRASPNAQKVVSLWILHLAIKQFREKGKAITLSWLIRHCRIPDSLAKPILNRLCETGLLIEIREDKSYLPGRSIEQLRMTDALKAIDSQGLSSSELPFFRAKQLEPFEKAMGSFQALMEKADANRLLSEM